MLGIAPHVMRLLRNPPPDPLPLLSLLSTYHKQPGILPRGQCLGVEKRCGHNDGTVAASGGAARRRGGVFKSVHSWRATKRGHSASARRYAPQAVVAVVCLHVTIDGVSGTHSTARSPQQDGNRRCHLAHNRQGRSTCWPDAGTGIRQQHSTQGF